MVSNHYARAITDLTLGAGAFSPPRRVTVSQGAAETLVLSQPGGGSNGPWSAEDTPYIIAPMDALASRRHQMVCFVGPARTGKTMGLVDGWAAHVIANDPGDMLIVNMTQDKAREYSKTRMDRALESPKLKALMTGDPADDNTHDKMFVHGMWLRIAWPTKSNLSGSDYRYGGWTDYDRAPDDIDGEGAGYLMLLKRTQTFQSRGMCMIESSPGRDVVDPNWRPTLPHEAPPTSGILGVYNNSDRARWYWQCPDCGEWFEAAPGLSLFGLPDDTALLDMVINNSPTEIAHDYNRIICPHCGVLIKPSAKKRLNKRGQWLRAGEIILPNGKKEGDGIVSNIAGFWLGGVAAAYQSWEEILVKYLQGLRTYAISNNEYDLKTVVNTDIGMPYTPMAIRASNAENAGPESHINNDLQRYHVPDEARFLVATCDVQGGQKSRFDVQITAVGPHNEKWVIDRYVITQSEREGFGDDKAPIDPASYAEDWDILNEKVLRATYRTSIEQKELRVKLLVVDSGGEDGVTDKAYAWFRKMRREGMGRRVRLYKGGSSKNAPMIKESFVGGKGGKVKGDIPLLIVNPNLLKDIVFAGIRRQNPGPGYIHFPNWVPKTFFDELEAEIRKSDGVYLQVRTRNESIDHLVMCETGCLYLGADKIKDWDNAPPWARPLPKNSELVTSVERREIKSNEAIPYEMPESRPSAPQPPTRPVARPRGRRVSYSPYMS